MTDKEKMRVNALYGRILYVGMFTTTEWAEMYLVYHLIDWKQMYKRYVNECNRQFVKQHVLKHNAV